MDRCRTIQSAAGVLMSVAVTVAAAETLVFDQPECAGMSGFRGHWDQPIPVAEDGARVQVDSQVKDRGQTAVWGGKNTGPLAFDAVHRHLLVRFPGAAEKLVAALKAGKQIERVELVLPYLDEEIWPQGTLDYPQPDGYRYRMNWGVDKLWRERRPNWHAVAWALRKPWTSREGLAPTYNAAIPGAVYWKRFGATDITEDRFPARLGPAEVSSYSPAGRMDVTAILQDETYGKTIAERLGVIADNGFVIQKEEVYDARFMMGSDAYEWATGSGPRAILVKTPQLVVTLKAGKIDDLGAVPTVDVAALATVHKEKPVGKPTAVVPALAEVKAVNDAFLRKPAWMADWQHARVKEIMGLESGGKVELFYYRLMPKHAINRARQTVEQAAKKEQRTASADELDYAVYLAWLDWINGQRPRSWQGHTTGHTTVLTWQNFRDALPGPVQDSIIRSWTAWLMPDRETAPTEKQRRDFNDTSGLLVHPMVDDPRVGNSNGVKAEWNQGYTYYRKTGDWRGNKSYYRSGFTRTMSTQNFNSSSTSGALLMGQIIGSEYAMEDGRAGLMQFPFWLWTHSSGVGQECIDHYYWALTFSGNKIFPDFAEDPEARMAGWSIIAKGINDLAGAWHPNLKKVLGPASRTYYQHVLGEMDGLYLLLHTIAPQGALVDLDTRKQPHLTMAKDAKGNKPRAKGAWGHDFPPALVAMQTMSGPWAEPWFSDIIEKPIPYESIVEKKVVSEGDWVTTYFGENYGLSSIRHTGQRIHVLGHWRRKSEAPKHSTEIGTLDMRVGFNDTRIANDGAGVISQQGHYRTYQSKNRLIMLARPNAGFLSKKKHVESVQTTAALFNFEVPRGTGVSPVAQADGASTEEATGRMPLPRWEIYVDKARVESLPATAKYGQVITIRDGVSYIALRPLPATDLGRAAEIALTPGIPQEPAHHGNVNIQPALLVNAHFYNIPLKFDDDAPALDEPPEPKNGGLKGLGGAQGGFVVEFGDEVEHGSFAKFQAHIAKTGLAESADRSVTYTTGKDTLVATWDSFTVNGVDPAAYAKEHQLWQDTSLVQMGKGRLEKNGAVIEKKPDWANLLLQTVPAKKLYAASNLLPNYQAFTFTTPDGVSVTPDGRLSMARIVVQNGKDITVKYHPFGGKYAPKDPAEAATVLLITGAKGKPQVAVNGKAATLKPWDGGWLVSLTGAWLPDAELAARLGKE